MRYMLDRQIVKPMSATQLAAASVAFAGAASTILLLAALHVLSPEYDPRWRMLSEYANGHYGWVLSLLFVCWASAAGLWPSRSGRKCRRGRAGSDWSFSSSRVSARPGQRYSTSTTHFTTWPERSASPVFPSRSC